MKRPWQIQTAPRNLRFATERACFDSLVERLTRMARDFPFTDLTGVRHEARRFMSNTDTGQKTWVEVIIDRHDDPQVVSWDEDVRPEV